MATTDERRRHPRIVVSCGVRLWLGDATGYLEGHAVDASIGGLGVELRESPEAGVFSTGRQLRADLVFAGEPLFRERVTIRHLSGLKLGLELDQLLPSLDVLDHSATPG